MRAVILAAGEGGRMGEHTDDLPKLFLDVAGRTIYDRQLSVVSDFCDAVTVVLGYGFEAATDEEIAQFVETDHDIDIEALVLADWAEVENATSCLRALEAIDDDGRTDGRSDEDVLLLCGDIVFDHAVLKRLLETFERERAKGYNVVGVLEGVQDEMTAVTWDDEGVITDYGAITGHQETGMFVLNGAHREEAKEILREYATEWFPVVFPRLPSKRVLLPERGHQEINTPEHLREAEAKLPFEIEQPAR